MASRPPSAKKVTREALQLVEGRFNDCYSTWEMSDVRRTALNHARTLLDEGFGYLNKKDYLNAVNSAIAASMWLGVGHRG